MRSVLLAGGTGLVGRYLAQALEAEGIEVLILTRRPETARLEHGQAHAWEELSSLVERVDGIVNLAGEGIADGRWTQARKKRLRESRVQPTQRIVQAIQNAKRKPEVLIQASAMGFYGDSRNPCTEASPAGSGFLPELCVAWEGAADPAPIRLVKVRLGIVLATDGGALPRMIQPVRCFVGSPLGSGQQYLSWVHVRDLVSLIIQALQNPAWSGAINAVAPKAINNRDFTRLLAKVMHRPLWPLGIPVGWMLKLALGEMAEAMLLQGVEVLPERAQALGFQFEYPDAEPAVRELIESRKGKVE